VLDELARASRFAEVHLLSASVVCVAAWALTSLRAGSATMKYWIWVATSLNLLLPLGLVLDGFRVPAAFGGAAHDVARTLAPAPGLLWGVWLAGALAMLARLFLRLRADARVETARAAADARPGFLVDGVPVRFGSSLTPAVDGVLRPRISLPSRIGHVLTREELDAVLAHELAHAKRGDNLIRLVHELALCAFWFHPLVWLTGARLALYRELSCDEAAAGKSRARELVSALAKLASGEEELLLQSNASSFLSRRLARLTSDPPRRALVMNALLAAAFGIVLLTGALATAARAAGTSHIAVFATAPCPSDEPVAGHRSVKQRNRP
jgi:beta-lactamase regulating signal transducer with metallopeptidase domain